jgi:uncharacterized protein
MKQIWSKAIRDPVHDLITFEGGETDELLFNLINTREFQRLRRIKQLGLSEMVFPGASHSRFAHSIGVMHIAKLIIDQIRTSKQLKISDEQRTAVLIAALLHDIGHGPFSHAFEKVTKDSHESRTLEIICDPSTEVNKILCKFQSDLPNKLKVFFNEDVDKNDPQGQEFPPILKQIISSQLDADRADYLLRDSYSTGTIYGTFDLKWLLLQQKVDATKARLCVGKKAASAVEAYIFARHHMYQTVYFHKTTRAAEVMLKLIFKRYRSLLQETGGIGNEATAPNCPPIIKKAFSAERVSLDDYLQLDDYAVTEFFKSCMNSSDRILSELGVGLVERKLFKAIDVSDGAQPGTIAEFVTSVRGEISEQNLDQDYSFVEDSCADTPYKPYDPDDDTPATQIYLETSSGKFEEISKKLEVLQSLRKRYTLLRYYFPSSQRDIIEKIANETILKGSK